MRRKIIIGALCIVIAVLLCITGILIGRLNKKSAVTSVVSKIEQGYNDRNLNSIVACFPNEFSDQIRDSFLNQASGGTEQDLWKLLEYSYGKDYTASFTVRSITYVDDNELSEKMKSINSKWNINLQAKEAAVCKVDEIYKGTKRAETTESYFIGKIDNDWYVLDVE